MGLYLIVGGIFLMALSGLGMILVYRWKGDPNKNKGK